MSRSAPRGGVNGHDASRPASLAPIDPFGDGGAANGRDERGRFAAGNAGGPGNPFSRQSADLRAALMRAVTVEDIEQIVTKLVALAKEGNLAAAKEVLERTVGRPVEAELHARLDELEDRVTRGGR